jgi:GT2 family glycosyltransferase
MPVKLAVMSQNGGYAMACNAGANLARGAALAMLNSDVLPINPGWLTALAKRLASNTGIGAVGGKLLYEDNSIQHAGLYFLQDHKGRWLNHHYFKGMPRDFAPALIEREVPAVTGACLILGKREFEAVDGFSTGYAIGDYEDSDLCLKIRQRGFSIAYVPEVELYHLERRSIRTNADYMRGIASAHNRWLHQQQWEETIVALMEGRSVKPGERVAA